MQTVIKRRYKEVFFIKPNNLGIEFLDDLFHRVVPYLKTMPWFVLVPLVFFLSLIFVFVFKTKAVGLVSLFQYGF